MGKGKQLIQDAVERGYAYNKEQGLPTFRPPVSAKRAVSMRNAKQHQVSTRWHENMPDLMGEALADAQRDFINEADNMPLWIQLELDLWEGKNGINEWTAWDVEGGTNRV